MATVSDYLDWRGDISFSDDPFNEVDNVLLSLIAYVDFEGVLDEEKGMSIGEVCRKYFWIHSPDEIKARDSYVKLVPFLMEKASRSRRYSKTVLHHYVNIIDADADEQMSAVTFDLEDGTSYAAFRGTDGSIIGWREDFNLAWLRQTRGQRHAVDYLNAAGNLNDRKLRVGGHSKGGNFAVYAAAFCGESVRNRILKVYTNDGPGFMQDVAESKEIEAICDKVWSLVPEQSLFGLLMYGAYDHEVIKSSAKGVFQHDAQTWQVLGSHFVRALRLSERSVLLSKTLNSWIADVEPEQRRKFVNFVFDVLETSGADTFSELHKNKIKNYGELIRAGRSMDGSRRKQFSEVLRVLARDGTSVLAQELKKNLDGKRKD